MQGPSCFVFSSLIKPKRQVSFGKGPGISHQSEEDQQFLILTSSLLLKGECSGQQEHCLRLQEPAHPPLPWREQMHFQNI